MTTPTYKYKSKIATAISFLAAFIVYIGKDGLTQIVPAEYAYYIPIIILIAGYIATQATENKRVNVAEQIVYEKMNAGTPDPAGEYPNLNEEYNIPVGEEDDGC